MNGHGGMRSPDRAWTEQEDETLRRMWARGEFASAIVRELPGRTRSSVMSRISRTIGKGMQGKSEVAEGEPAPVSRPVEFLSADELLSRLDAGPHGPGGPVRQPKPAIRKAEPPKCHPIAPERKAEPVARKADVSLKCEPVTILGLTESRCHWPLGDPRSEAFRYCGAPKKLGPDHPYCNQHAAMAINPAETRRLRRKQDGYAGL